MSGKSGMTRRSFMKTAGGALAAGVAFRSASVLGANEKIGLGFIGVGGRGGFHLSQFSKMDDVNVIAVADASKPKRDAAVARVKNAKIQAFEDYRKLLELKDIDAVVVATPDHWHAIPTILACQAGKDVYVEKPTAHNVRESRAMVQAARKYDRVVQLGTQHRSGPTWIQAVDLVKSGKIGKVSLVRSWNCWDTKSIHADMGNPPDSDPPPGVNYDLWLGPAKKRPFNPRHFDFYFYYFWEYSGGMLSAWGVHLFDVVTWAMGPTITSVTTVGGKLVYNDARDTPDTAGILFECPKYLHTYEVRHGNGKDPWGGMDHGIEFYGTEGAIWINRNGYTLFPESDRKSSMFVPDRGQDEPHKRNWLDCIRSRKRPNADIELGHLGSVPGFLGNIAYRVGRKIKWDGEQETIPGDPEAERLLGREYREPYVLPKV
jgi:predicted dehydrogenase